jgi:hypothetical protein
MKRAVANNPTIQQVLASASMHDNEGSYVVNLGHNQYIHIKDKNTNTTR